MTEAAWPCGPFRPGPSSIRATARRHEGSCRIRLCGLWTSLSSCGLVMLISECAHSQSVRESCHSKTPMLRNSPSESQSYNFYEKITNRDTISPAFERITMDINQLEVVVAVAREKSF